MTPLNFNNEKQIVEELNYYCMVWNHEHVGLSWDELKKLFPESADRCMKKYYLERD